MMNNLELENALKLANDGEFERAFTFLIQMARDGNQIAQLKIASMYQFGEGVSADGNAAVHWYKQAADQAIADRRLAGLAHHNLQVLYLCGAAGVHVDNQLAAMHLNKAKEYGVQLY
jgi:uncharacterized protein